MGKGAIKDRIFTFFETHGGYAHTKELKKASFKTADIKQWVEKGLLEKIKPGLYRLADLDYPEGISLSFVDVSRAIPDAVICLISALSYYDLTTFNPSEIYVAIRNHSSAPNIFYPPVKIFYFRDRFYEPGIEIIKTEYGDVKLYNREKTVCDMFRYRNKLGEDLALEGLKNYLASHSADLYTLRQYATICQVKSVVFPYLKALVG
jgi:predicted transcriptional regulator of viral defense system